MKISFRTDALLAALECAAVKDLRAYITGVCIRIKKPSVGMIYGTDGFMAFAGQLPFEGECSSLDIIIPSEIIKKLNKKQERVELEHDNSQYLIGGMRFIPLEGTFPDVGRVIPTIDTGTPQLPANFNPDLLIKARKALRLYTGAKNEFSLFQRGEDAAVMHSGTNDCLVVVGSLRESRSPKFAGFNREFM